MPDPATTSLLLACREGGSENDPVPQVAEAINNGANVDFVSSGDENANTALHWCAWRGAVGSLGCLVRAGASLSRRNNYNETPLMTAENRHQGDTTTARFALVWQWFATKAT